MADHSASAAVEIKDKHDAIGSLIREKKGAGGDVKAEVCASPLLASKANGEQDVGAHSPSPAGGRGAL